MERSPRVPPPVLSRAAAPQKRFSPNQPDEPGALIPAGSLVAFSSLIFGAEFIIYPTLVILPSFYAAMTGGTGALAGAIFASGLVYSFGGPVVGYLSDRVRTPWGRRKPWIVAGSVTAVASVYLLFFPSARPSPAYFGWAAALALLSFSLIDIPYLAWGTEITRDYRDRSRVASFRSVFSNAGILVLVALPLIPGFGGRSFLDPLVISRLGTFALVALPLTVVLALFFGPRFQESPNERPRSGDFQRLLRTMARNRPLWYFVPALATTWVGLALQITLGLPFLSSLGIVDWYSPLTILSYIVALGTTPLWLLVTYRIGKHRAWASALVVQLTGIAVYFTLSAFDTKTAVVALTLVRGVVLQAIAVIPYSLLGDIIDYDTLRTRTSHASSYTAATLLIIRLPVAFSGAIGFALLSTFHYRIGVPNPPAARVGMFVAYFAIPAACALVSILCLWWFPLDARKQAIVRRRLETRAQPIQT